MSIQDLIKMLEKLGIEQKIYPFSLPSAAPEECILIETGDGSDLRGDVSDFILSLTVRAAHPAKAEALALSLLGKLKNLTGVKAGDTEIILVRSLQKLPSSLGKDENGYYYFETNYTVLAS